MIKLIFFITKSEIFGYDMSDMTAPVQIGFEGNESVQLSEPEAIESCCSCITERYNVDDFSDDDFDFVIIDCNARKKYIPEFAKKVQTCRKMSVYPLEKLIVPALINSSRVPENTVYVSYGEFTYKVFSSEGVYCTEKVKRDDADIKLTEADFSFVFNFNELSSQSTSAAAAPVEDTAQLAVLNAEIEKLTEKLSENEQTITELQSEIAEKDEALEQQACRAAYTDNNELKEKLRELMGEMLTLDDYAVESSFSDGKNFYTVIHIATDFRMSFSVNSIVDETTVLRMLKSALLNLSDQVKLTVSPYASLEIGDRFELGRYNQKPILWRVLDKYEGVLTVISDEVICDKAINLNTSYNGFMGTELYEWLNGVFYRSSFNTNEKSYIKGDLSLLSKSQMRILLGDDGLSDYWLLDYYAGVYSNSHYYASGYGESNSCSPDNKYGVRPVLNLMY